MAAAGFGVRANTQELTIARPRPLLGCIADDFAGAAELASTLSRNGMRAVQLIGAPGPDILLPAADAIVVAFKSRGLPARQAARQSLVALQWLQGAGCRQFMFKHRLMFDGADVGSVADALVDALGCGFAISCPAFPAQARTVYQGHLFVGSALLNESGMQDHPSTPMRDANLVRALSRQTENVVGLVPFPVVDSGPVAIRNALTALKEQGRRYAIVDALNDAHLLAIGEAVAAHPIVTGGSGIAIGLAENFRRAGFLGATGASVLPPVRGSAAILAGSCSRTTLLQVAVAKSRFPSLQLDPIETADPVALSEHALAWAKDALGDAPLLIAASAPPGQVAALQARLGRDAAGAMIEDAMARIATGLAALGVRRLIVAGGETGGAVVSALGVRSMAVGAEIDPGAPWTYAEGEMEPMWLALKGGNVGAPDFFARAFETPPG